MSDFDLAISAIQTLATVVLALVTYFLYLATENLHEATRYLARVQIRPKLIAYPKKPEEAREVHEIMIQNVGAGAALDGKLVCKTGSGKEVRYSFARMDIGSVYKYEANRQPLQIDIGDWPVVVQIRYTDMDGSFYDESVTVEKPG